MIVRYSDLDGGAPRLGVLSDGRVQPVTGVETLAEALAQPGHLLSELAAQARSSERWVPREAVRLLPPVDGRTEIWGAGVTYARSRDARIEESGREDVYGRVYAAERPELFLKGPAWRAVGPEDSIAVRADAGDSVAEPELALVVDRAGEIVGYTICNDVTARGIEGENPLYLPQAKIFTGSCALGPGIRLATSLVADSFDIALRVERDGEPVFTAATTTANMRRGFGELVSWLTRELDFPGGVVLATGTGIVPELDQGVRPGDVVEIRIDQIGVLRNAVAASRHAAGT